MNIESGIKFGRELFPFDPSYLAELNQRQAEDRNNKITNFFRKKINLICSTNEPNKNDFNSILSLF